MIQSKGLIALYSTHEPMFKHKNLQTNGISLV